MDAGLRIIMTGASGAVGGSAVSTLLAMPGVSAITLLNRRPLGLAGLGLSERIVDLSDPASYAGFLAGHDAAICTVGVGEPSKADPAEVERIDRDIPLAFAKACRASGIRHFQMLVSVGANARSTNRYLKVKGELEEGLEAISFPRLSLFEPSMILTPENRYGALQGVLLALWPKLQPLLAGPLRKYRGVHVDTLGAAIARNAAKSGAGVERLHWDDFQRLS